MITVDTNKKGYRQLKVWQNANQLARLVHLRTASFPAEERFVLLDQMRRAGLSVPANIVEGWTSPTVREKKRFYNIAKRSLAELEYYIDFAHYDLGYLDAEAHLELNVLREKTARLLTGFIRAT